MNDLLNKVRQRQSQATQGDRTRRWRPAIEAVCLKALSKRPEDRYQTALELAAEVRRYLADEPVEAFPEPFSKRLARWTKRHRTAVAAAAVLGATGLVALSTGYVLVSRERDEATAQRGLARRAVNDMYSGVADDWLEDTLDSKQKEFLELALDYYRNFSGRDSGIAGGAVWRRRWRWGESAIFRTSWGITRMRRRRIETRCAILGALQREASGESRYRFERARLTSRLGALLDTMGSARRLNRS